MGRKWECTYYDASREGQKEGKIDRRTNKRRRVGLVEGGKDRFVDFWREVLTDEELGRQICRQI